VRKCKPWRWQVIAWQAWWAATSPWNPANPTISCSAKRCPRGRRSHLLLRLLPLGHADLQVGGDRAVALQHVQHVALLYGLGHGVAVERAVLHHRLLQGLPLQRLPLQRLPLLRLPLLRLLRLRLLQPLLHALAIAIAIRAPAALQRLLPHNRPSHAKHAERLGAGRGREAKVGQVPGLAAPCSGAQQPVHLLAGAVPVRAVRLVRDDGDAAAGRRLLRLLRVVGQGRWVVGQRRGRWWAGCHLHCSQPLQQGR
jgi:hypothetical protein